MNGDKRYGSRAGNPRKRRASIAPPARTISYMQNLIFDVMNGKRITQATVAAAIGKHPVTLSYWKTGVHEVKAVDLEAMAAALGYRWKLVKNEALDEVMEDVKGGLGVMQIDASGSVKRIDPKDFYK